ncbi:uncharacterized protein LOC126906967 isoform X2 [Daktulosphaira vitifoliae]|uniref:uncharacterized protein LOC126906967 isoform X2 n=1 Tax=Daktulosphaira vitifoliae TaxID=58002 RepID=UPI0021AB014C|nr:uncharacterized protein LOC126906967 isoform X2 [Daktulosphaira vitifoliae]
MIVKMTFVNEANIFAEIRLRYDDYRGTSIKKKDIIDIIITFGNQNIILTYKNEHKFLYNANGFNALQTSLENINKNIYFKVVKIYNSNFPINGNLVNNTVYDEEIRNQLSNVENLFLWKYAKEDLVSILYPSCPNITLEHLINNSTTYRKTIEKTLITAIDIMKHRTARYACLLVVYAYEALRINEALTGNWEKVIQYLEKLGKAEKYLEGCHKKSSFSINISYALSLMDFTFYSTQKLFNLNQLVTKFVKYTVRSRIINEEDLIKADESKSNETNTHILTEDILIDLFIGFPKPLQNHDFAYDFDVIPFSLDDINEKLFIIFELIDTEYEKCPEEN